MPRIIFELSTGGTINLVFLRQFPNLYDMLYLQSIRSGRITEDSDMAQSYKGMASFYAIQLVDLVAEDDTAFDAVICPPSSRSDATPYSTAVQRRFDLNDLSRRFSRDGTIRSADASSSTEDIINVLKYEAKGDENQIHKLLIVDDSFASGNSVTAILHHLKEAGLGDSEITVAVPAFLKDCGKSFGF